MHTYIHTLLHTQTLALCVCFLCTYKIEMMYVCMYVNEFLCAFFFWAYMLLLFSFWVIYLYVTYVHIYVFFFFSLGSFITHIHHTHGEPTHDVLGCVCVCVCGLQGLQQTYMYVVMR